MILYINIQEKTWIIFSPQIKMSLMKKKTLDLGFSLHLC